MELLSLIVLEYICCKILAWFFSVFGGLHDSCNFAFAMRWVFWKVKRPQGWAFHYLKSAGILLFKTPSWLSLWYTLGIMGIKSNTRFLCLAKPSAVGFSRICASVCLKQPDVTNRRSISLQQQLLTNTSLCLSHATICEQHRFACLFWATICDQQKVVWYPTDQLPWHFVQKVHKQHAYCVPESSSS